MAMFEQLRPRITDPSKLSAVGPEKLLPLRQKFPSIPESNLQFLQEIGSGNIGGMQIYTGPIDPAFIYPIISEALAPVALFGDDYQSYFCFDTKHQYQVVEVDPTGELRPLDAPSEVFIQKYVD